MSGALIAQLIAALGGGALIQAILAYLRDHRQIKIRDDIAAASKGEAVEDAGLQNLQKKLSYLKSLVDALGAQNQRQQKEIEHKDTMIYDLREKVWGLQSEIQDVRTKCKELDTTCDQLQRQLGTFRNGPPSP